MDNFTVPIKLTAEEIALAERYAKNHNVSVEEAFKCALFDRIEDEFDAAIAKDAYDSFIRGGSKSKSFSELLKELGL